MAKNGSGSDPYAAIATETDPYAAIAEDAGPDRPGVPTAPLPAGLQGASAAPASDNALQRSVDLSVAHAPQDSAFTSGVKSIASTIASPIVHPVQAATSFRDALLPFSLTPGGHVGFAPSQGAQQLDATERDFRQNGVKKGLADLTGQGIGMAAMAGAGGGAGAELSRLGGGLQSGGSATANIGLRTIPDEYGGDPGMAAVQNGISGFTPRSVLAQTKASIPGVALEHRAALSAYGGDPIDIGNEVVAPFNEIRSAKTNPVSGGAQPARIAMLNRTKNLLTHVPDEFSGTPTTAMRPLGQISPLQANDLKSNIYDMTDYDNPSRSSLANDALKQSAHGILQKVRTAVPDSAVSGDNLHNLMALKGELTPQGGIPTSRADLLANVWRKGGTSVGGKMYRLGENIPSLKKLIPALAVAGATGGVTRHD